jgi:hypothetical protein
MKRGAKMMNLDHDPDPQDWFTLFDYAYVSLDPKFADPGNGDDMRDFGLNLAASDPLTLFYHSEFDGEGNLFPSYLSVAWLGATALLGSIHLFYDVELQTQRLAAQMFDNIHEENDDYAFPTEGIPLNPWNDLSPSDQHTSHAFTYSQRLGEDAKDRCLNDLCESFLRFLKIKAKDMTIVKWSSAFTNASTPGSLIFPTLKGRELRSFGADLARSSPTDLFLAHEWVKWTHLRPQTCLARDSSSLWPTFLPTGASNY